MEDPLHGAEIDALVSEQGFSRARRGPGLGLAVVMRGAVKIMKGYGFADIDGARAIDPDTTFDLASVAKQFTAVAVLRLAERGLLSLADPASKFLPELAVHDTPARPIRVEDLLHMTSGLTEYTTDEELFAAPAKLDNTRVLRFAAEHPLDQPPGTKFDYVNTNYSLLALIVARVSGRPFGAFLRDEVLVPAGMRDAQVLDHVGQEVRQRAQGYRRKRRAWVTARDDAPVVGDGNVFASLADMVAWDRALARIEANARTPRDPTDLALLSAASLRAAFTSGRLDAGAPTFYGFGWNIDDGARRRVDHSGGWSGTSTYIARYLDDALTLVLLSNDEDFDTDIATPIAALYLPP